jgi:integrase
VRYKRCSCAKSKWPDCPHIVWVKVKRMKVSPTPIRESLEEYFNLPGKIRGRGAWSEAKRWERRFIADVDDGTYTAWKAAQAAPASDGPPTLLTTTGLRDAFKASLLERHKHWGRQEGFYKRLIRFWGPTRPAAEIGLADVLNFLAPLRGLAPNTVANYGELALKLLKFGAANSLIPRLTFAKRDLDLPAKVGRSQLLTYEEEAILFQPEVMDPFLRDAADITLGNGLRKRTVRELQVYDFRALEHAYGSLHIPPEKMKGKRASTKRLAPRTRAAIDRRIAALKAAGRYRPDAYFFGDGEGQMYVEETCILAYLWNKARKKVALPTSGPLRVSFHDLRASFACRLFEQTRDVRKVMRALDHTKLEQTQTYLERHLGDLDNTEDAFIAIDAETTRRVAEAVEQWRETGGGTKGGTPKRAPSQNTEQTGNDQYMPPMPPPP